MTRALQFGMVAVNRTKVTGAPIPFGGFKQSGLGREGARLGMEAFMEVNTFAATGAELIRRANPTRMVYIRVPYAFRRVPYQIFSIRTNTC